MAKRLTLICLLSIAYIEVKAQTYCYHFYKYIDPVTNISHSLDQYFYFHFQGKYCYLTVEKDDEYEGGYLYRYDETTADNCDFYVFGMQTSIRPRSTYKGKSYSERGFTYADGFTVLTGLQNEFYEYFYVSSDKSSMNWRSDVWDGVRIKKVLKVGERVNNPPPKQVKPTMVK